MRLSRLVSCVGRRRLPPAERLRHDAFLSELDGHADRSAVPVWLELRSQCSHLGYRLFGEGPTLVQVSIAAAITAAGSVVLTLFASPEPTYGEAVPAWVQAMFGLGLFALAFELGRSPRRLRPRRFAFASAGPLGAVLLVGTATFRIVLWPDWLLLAGIAGCGLGFVTMAVGALRGTDATILTGFAVVAAGAAAVSVADAIWTAVFARVGDGAEALGCSLGSLGTGMVAIGLARARAALATRSTVDDRAVHARP